MTEQAVIDRAALAILLEMVGGDAAFLNELIDDYYADTMQLLATMRDGVSQNNAAEVHRAAHSLKSNSASFGAHRLAELCRELEERGKQGALHEAAPLLAHIEAEYENVKRVLQTVSTGSLL